MDSLDGKGQRMTPPEKPRSGPAKGKREVDQVLQIAYSQGGKVTSRNSGDGKHTITIFADDVEDQKFRSMLYAIESAVHGRFDRGQHYQSMTQFSLKSSLIDVIVRGMK